MKNNIWILSTSVAEVEGQVNMYGTITTICVILSALFFILSVVLFFVFKIPKIISVKTGRDAKKVIKEYESGKETSQSKMLRRKNIASTGKLRNTGPLNNAGGISSSDNRLSANENMTTVLEEGTTVLSPQDVCSETVLLNSNSYVQPILNEQIWQGEHKFILVRNIIMIHTQEIV